MTNQCNKCYRVEDVTPLKYNPSSLVSLKQWSESAEGSVQVTTQKTTVSDIFKIMKSKLLKLKTHVLIKNVQAQFFKEKRECISQTEAVLLLDFAENFAITSQDQFQSDYIFRSICLSKTTRDVSSACDKTQGFAPKSTTGCVRA